MHTLLLTACAHVIGVTQLAHWLVQRQMSAHGGFQGRTNKLVDGCYSFWQGAAFPVMLECVRAAGKKVPRDHMWCDPQPLQRAEQPVLHRRWSTRWAPPPAPGAKDPSQNGSPALSGFPLLPGV